MPKLIRNLGVHFFNMRRAAIARDTRSSAPIVLQLWQGANSTDAAFARYGS